MEAGPLVSGHLRLVVDNEPAQRDWQATIDDYRVWLERWRWAGPARREVARHLDESTDELRQLVAEQAEQITQLRAVCGLPHRPSPATNAAIARVSS